MATFIWTTALLGNNTHADNEIRRYAATIQYELEQYQVSWHVLGLANEMIEKYPSVTSFTLCAETRLRLGDNKWALECIFKAKSLIGKTRDKKIELILAETLLANDRYEDSIKIFLQYEKMFWKEAKVSEALGKCYQNLRKFTEAIEQYEEAAKIGSVSQEHSTNLNVARIARDEEINKIRSSDNLVPTSEKVKKTKKS